MIELIEVGPFATIQDGGRVGYAHLGVARSGAFDRAALQLANRLVGNSPEAPAIEFTLGGLGFRAHDAVTVAVAGAVCPGLGWGVATTIAPGAVVRFGAPSACLRSYLAVRGGLDVTAELNSCSTDTMSGLGPPPLRSGDRLSIGGAPQSEVSGAVAHSRRLTHRLRLVIGPRDDWFDPHAVDTLTSAAWTVRADSNRIGLRLDGPRLERVRTDELASEPTVPGALQVPPDGRPILLGPDAPVTGGYPVIAVVRRPGMDVAGQLRPGDVIWFSP